MSTAKKLQDRGFSPLRLRELRTHHGKSQSHMAVLLGSPKSTYVSWETGAAVPSVAAYDAIVTELGVEALFYLMGLTSHFDCISTPIDKIAGSDLARDVEACFRRVGLNFNAGDVFEMTASLLEIPAEFRAQRLEGIESGLAKARKVGGQR